MKICLTLLLKPCCRIADCMFRSRSYARVLADGGVYFDPEDSASIATAIKRILDDFNLRSAIAKRAKELASQYSWFRCYNETWDFLVETSKSGNLKIVNVKLTC